MVDTRVKISSVVENQLPSFVREEFPLISEFLAQYYKSLEYQSGPVDILENIDRYIKLEELDNLTESTTTTSSIDFFDDVINVTSTAGFPDSYGLIKIDSEIITYTEKTDTTFNGCVRGFSGVSSYQNPNRPDSLVFSTSEASNHNNESTVLNLSILFLKEFFKKVKRQFVPGFEERDFYADLNKSLFIKQSKDFYSSKGTDQSFEILFRALYGEDVQVIRPSDYLFTPSDAQYLVTRDLIVKSLEGNPEDLQNGTLYQDKTDIFEEATGTVTKVEKIFRGNSEYYIISLDYTPDEFARGFASGSFPIHSQTKVIASTFIGDTTLDVDSTLGFPKSGEIVVDFENGTSITISYTSKSYTQFYGCSGITQNILPGQNVRVNSYAYGYSGIGTNNIVKVQVTGVLSNLNVDSDSRYYEEEELVKIKTLGKNSSDIKSNNWIFNIPIKYEISSISLLDSSNLIYQLKTYDEHNFGVGDSLRLLFPNGTERTLEIISVPNKNTFNVFGEGEIDTTKSYQVVKEILKTKSIEFPEANIYSTNVQNVYDDLANTYYVTASSLPSYFNSSLNAKPNSVTFSGIFDGTDLNIGYHPFYTGDSVTYVSQSDENTLNISEREYFVEKINSTTIRIAYSRQSLYKKNYINVSGISINSKFVDSDLTGQTLDSQKLIRKLQEPNDESGNYITQFGSTGMLVNGVEILNYKSKDKVFYGPLEQIEVTSPGSDYDVINPPVLSIIDEVGVGATGYCEVEGQLERIEVIDGGFDYITDPTITITGGRGFGAKASAELSYFRHSVSFNAIQSAGLVNLSENTIGFSSHHKFRDAEKVIYSPDGQQGVGGLTTDSTYYVSVKDAFNVKLHNTYEDATVGINTIDLISYGSGSQRFLSAALKNKIISINVYDKGVGYRNRKISVPSSGINTSLSVIVSNNHRYNTGDVIVYSSTSTPVEGLISGQSYYVTSLNENTFKLSQLGSVGVGTQVDFYYNTNQYINLKSSGSGYHVFNYPPISVQVSGLVGVSTKTGQNFNAVLQPIVRGEIKSVFIESGGSNYGSEEILNYNRQPIFNLNTGSGAQVTPIILDGGIVDVLVTSPGSGYNSPPTLEIVGSGFGAKLTPVISGGVLSEVKVISNGVGFETSRTTINVIPSGSGARFQSTPKTWTVNLVERNIQNNQISDDDGFIDRGINSNYGLQYTHSYAPRKLRQTILSKKFINGELTYVPDLIIENNKEVLSDSHSPIIGWAYDGNPIYGPYGYADINGGLIKILTSGYKINLNPNRPRTSLYPSGFFVEDFEYNSSGDLDKYNGRFCITPEYPNGVYAYFATIDNLSVESSGSFRNYRKPVFPYFIGNEFKSKPIDYNFDPKSNQDDIDVNLTGVLRNTTPYNLLNEKSGYDFLINPNKIKEQNSVVKYAKYGSVDSIGITTGGSDYKTKDQVIFNNEGSGGQGATAIVSTVKGKKVNQISVNRTFVDNLEIVPFSGQNSFIGFSSIPHQFTNLDNITITGLSTFGTKFNSNYNVGVKTDTFVLSSAIGSTSITGIVTYLNVFGTLSYPYIRENDIFQLNSEKVKVLNIDKNSGRIRVLRKYDSTVGTSHSASTLLYERSRKFTFNVGINSTLFEYTYNREIYFDPSESVGLGTIFGVGIGYTLSFSNPGVGVTSLFIPTKAIYLPDHNLNTGDKLIYSSNGGTPVSISTDGISSIQLTDNQVLYAAKITNDLIGIATSKIGVGSTGNFVGINSSVNTDILYFTNVGSGVIHSFKTDHPNVIKAKGEKNLVTVSTASTHGLRNNDWIYVSCLPGITTTYQVKYNDYNRRMVTNPRDFSSGDVDISKDTIAITSHRYETGQRVIHTSSSPSGGLLNNQIYFVVKVDNDRIKLSDTFYNSTLSDPICIDITSPSLGTLSQVGSLINVIPNQTVIFDLSDSTLSYVKNLVRYPAFEFKFYYDYTLKNVFETSTANKDFEVSRSGAIGVSTNARVVLNVSNNLPSELYYSLVPINLDENVKTKVEITNENDFGFNPNKIQLTSSLYSGQFYISGVTTNTFSYSIYKSPERSSYISSEADLSYVTDSPTAFGEINAIRLVSKGLRYKNLPKSATVSSLTGTGAELTLSSQTIGKVGFTEIQDIGFEYSSDKSLRPTAYLAQILQVTALSTFKRIGISSVGRNYTIAPNLIVIDAITNSVVDDVDISYNIGDSEVSIFKNTKGINNKTPTIIPINNSNGIGINSITFNSATKDVVIGLAVSYSNASDFPFEVGDKVLIENTSVGIGTTSKGYNSSAYGYALFELKSIDPNIGGVNGSVTYNMTDYLADGENPGTFSLFYSSGRITPQKFFPTFNIELESNQFYKKEILTSPSASGIVEGWNSSYQTIKVFSNNPFNPGEKVVGSSSNSQAIVTSVEEHDAVYDVDASSIVKKGWQIEKGFLNNDFQRIHDSDYYQYFSYSIKSKVEYEKWNDAVSSLNHTAGFKKFSDLIVESSETEFSGISTEQNLGEFLGIVDFTRELELNCINDFDLATERTLNINSNVISDKIVLNSATVQDYFESFGNRVLMLDDISGQFNSNPRSTRFSTIGTFKLSSGNVRKFITHVKDKRFTKERQIYLVSTLHNNNNAYINQYGRVETFSDMGTFDISISGDEGNLLFYPVDYEVNNFDASYVSYNLKDTITGIGTLSLGDVVDIKVSNNLISSGTTGITTIVGISSTYRASKVLVEIAAVDGEYYQFDEVSLVHDGTNVEIIDYGQLTDENVASLSSSGLGTYGAYLTGSNVNLTFTPNVGVAVSYVVNTLRISIANTSLTGIGTETLNTGQLKSNYVSIAASSSPTENVISQYNHAEYNSAYYVVCVEDTTNNRVQMSEVVVADSDDEVSLVEFGEIYTHSGLGTIGAGVSGQNIKLYFTPNVGINAQVRVFQNSLGLVNDFVENNLIDLNSGSIDTGFGVYRSTTSDIKREFDITHKELPIFERTFNGSDSSVVSIVNNTIKIPNHFFVTGEKLIYSNSGAGTTQAIGIATTSIVGVGTTDKLSSTVYAIKVDELNIKLAATAENALKSKPVELDITSLGIGTNHKFICENQNARVLISIDNVIQSPIVSTAVTYANSLEILTTDDTITLSGITSIFGGDLLKINEEIVRVDSVGFGSTNVLLVERSWMGTGLATHAQYSNVTKVFGDYNIINNRINFNSAPYGTTPIGTTTSGPDELDWIGVSTNSTFSGRAFLRSGVKNTSSDTYSKNYIFDDISVAFTGIKTEFTIKSNGSNITGISTSNSIILINEIFQEAQRATSPIRVSGDYTLRENAGITSIQFTGIAASSLFDIKTANIPTGGLIISVGSSNGLGYQPLISAGGTAIVSTAGTISSISIGNSGSGYRSGIQTVVNVGIATSSTGIPNIAFIGTAAISGGHIVSVAITNPGVGYTSSNPPIVIFDAPVPYSNIPLVYSSSSILGIGTRATVDIVVGQGSSVIDFEIKNLGYGYGQGNILTVPIGGTVGIPTQTSPPFQEFKIIVERTQSDKFSGWTIGDLEVFDKIDNLFDDITLSFPLTINGEQKTIKAKTGSLIDVQSTLLVFLNDILQVPGEGYVFEGGSYITFTEAPKIGDTCKIIFYKGTGDVDVIEVDILESIKVGDFVTLDSDIVNLKEDERLVAKIISSNTIETIPYAGPGITQDISIERPLIWCKQSEDMFINGKAVTKDRVFYEPLIQPTSNIIQNVGIDTNVIYVESVKTFFDSDRENTNQSFQSKIKIVSQDNLISAAATAVVSTAGTIASIVISNGGVGYNTAPNVTIGNPVGLGTTQRASASSTISIGGSVSSISVTSSGTGYTSTNPPVVLIESPSSTIEEISDVTYSGDFGIISGISTISVGVASTGIVFDLFIPVNSYLRDSEIVGAAITISGIQTGYYFVVSNSNIGNGVTSLNNNRTTLSIGSSFIDNVYQVASVSIAQTSALGIGLTYVAKVVVSVSNYNGLTGIGYSNFYGQYSWGRIDAPIRESAKSFNLSNNGLSGVSTAPVVIRTNPLKYFNYI